MMRLALHLALGSVAVAVAHADDYAPSSGSGSDCSFVCSDLLQPVCGSDGMTYPNECFLSLADCNSPETITKANDGACSTTETTSETSSTASSSYPTCSDVCPMIYMAVCGSDGVTYSNDCLLGVAQCQSGGTITKVSDGECPGSYPTTGSSEAGEAGSESTGCSEVCIEIWRPVCGSDGVTYANSCFLGIETCKNPSVTQVSEGPCPTTGGSYGSNSDSSNESTPVDSETSSASSSTSCPDVCTDIYAPVCGSDGVTYSSECLLGVAQCKSDGSITKVSDGECPSYPTTGSSEAGEAGSETTGCSEVCIEIWRPVCGSDGVTYANSCFLGIETCKNPNITQVNEGPCPTTRGSYGSTTNSTDSSEESTPDDSEASSTSCPDVCTAIYAPVCGSDGVTYSSECRLDVACCKNPELHITKVHDGACVVECKTQL